MVYRDLNDDLVEMTKEEFARELNHSKLMGALVGSFITIIATLVFLYYLEFRYY